MPKKHREVSTKEFNRNQFYQFPKWLLLDPAYADLSLGARVLYMILSDRHKLSMMNGWADKQGKIFLLCSREEMASLLKCSEKTARTYMQELKNLNLIKEKWKGWIKQTLIYVLEPDDPDITADNRAGSENEELPPAVNFTAGEASSPTVNFTAGQAVNFTDCETVKFTVSTLDQDLLQDNKTEVSESNKKNGGCAAEKHPPAQEQKDQRREEKKEEDKHDYGEYNNVKLTDKDLMKLLEKHGEEKTIDYIDKVSNYMQSSGKEYKDHAATISYWIRRDTEKDEKQAAAQTEKTKPKNRFDNFKQRKYSEEDFAHTEKLEREYLRQKYNSRAEAKADSASRY